MNTLKDLGCPIGLCNNDNMIGGKKDTTSEERDVRVINSDFFDTFIHNVIDGPMNNQSFVSKKTQKNRSTK
jgi:hypothetical protein